MEKMKKIFYKLYRMFYEINSKSIWCTTCKIIKIEEISQKKNQTTLSFQKCSNTIFLSNPGSKK